MSKSFRLDFPSNELAVRDALQSIRQKLETWSVASDDQDTVELVTAEALNNVVEHAYSGPDKTGTIQVSGAFTAANLHVTITDTGVPMPNGALPNGDPVSVDTSLEDLPEGGFGWSLIHILAQDLQYQRQDGVNILQFKIPLGQTA